MVNAENKPPHSPDSCTGGAKADFLKK